MSGRCVPLVLEHDERHGTKNGYYDHGCRCDRCKAAYREFRAARKAEGLRPGDDRHGSLQGYNLFGCRCESCRKAKADQKDRLNPRTRALRSVIEEMVTDLRPDLIGDEREQQIEETVALLTAISKRRTAEISGVRFYPDIEEDELILIDTDDGAVGT